MILMFVWLKFASFDSFIFLKISHFFMRSIISELNTFNIVQSIVYKKIMRSSGSVYPATKQPLTK